MQTIENWTVEYVLPILMTILFLLMLPVASIFWGKKWLYRA